MRRWSLILYRAALALDPSWRGRETGVPDADQSDSAAFMQNPDWRRDGSSAGTPSATRYIGGRQPFNHLNTEIKCKQAS